ncbi:E3 ubiquitin-protein ligase NHLRC1 [Hyla sarda]|uniref:E3 ubiquitin-protein ligase NHLRC1 n=1 Tax=Hyla sarda TaxID=327740 RepID=UPI0024C2E9C9|nr:E3 ubiquitin-protein ligase NHLRC1 [Hyla sarda]
MILFQRDQHRQYLCGLQLHAMSSSSQREIRTMKDFLEETDLNLLECKVCFEKYGHQQRHRPKNLPCGHIICQHCVSSLCLHGNQRLECPFCRKGCRKQETSVCLPILHLLEIIGRVVPDHPEASSVDCSRSQVTSLKSANFNLSMSFGGWGVLFNPTGIAFCTKTKSLVVSHDGKKRIARFTMNGKCLQQTGAKADSDNAIIYPADVAVTFDGFLIVTDTGDRSLKVFCKSGVCKLVVKHPFSFPWGLGINSRNEIIVSDPDTGNLVLLAMDFDNANITKCLDVYSHLNHPREIAVCQASGEVIVVEHVVRDSKTCSSTCLKLFSSEMKPLRQIDSFSLSLLLPLPVHTSGVAFDHSGNILLADINNRCVICLQRIGDFHTIKHVVASGLSYPVALAVLEDGSVAVLDSGNHSVLMYSP